MEVDGVTYTWDANRNLLSDGVNTYAYDSRNRLMRVDYFDGQAIQYTYAPTGRRETVVDGRGTTSYGYDHLDRLTWVTQPNGQEVAYTYDAAGNRTSMTTSAGTVGYIYDEANRLSSVTDPWGGETSFRRACSRIVAR